MHSKQFFSCLFFLLFSLIQSASAQERKQALVGVNPAGLVNEIPKEKVDTSQLYKIEKIKIGNAGVPQVTLKNVVYTAVDQPLPSLKFPKDLNIQVKIGTEQKQVYAFAFIPQYIQDVSGEVKKIASYEIELLENPSSNKTTGNRVYATNSVLATGSWHLLSIAAQGIYKLDYNFLRDQVGINMSNLNPANIRIYGNGGEMLSEDNGVIPPDDLIENHIEVVGGGDGKFDPGDYILFYANGPHTILPDSANKRFSHAFNTFSEVSYYFLNVDLGPGKRIAQLSPLPAANQSTNTTNFFRFLEEDVNNPGNVGKTWWSDIYANLPGKVLSKTFNFSVPNILSSQPVRIDTRVGGIAFAGVSNFRITANGQLADNIPLNAIGTNFNDPVINAQTSSVDVTLSGNSIAVNTNFTPSNTAANGFLDYIRINGRQQLIFYNQCIIADWNTVGPGNITEFQLAQANGNTAVWDITNPLQPLSMPTTLVGGGLTFRQSSDRFHRFIAFDGSGFLTPKYVGIVPNQNLHSRSAIDYIIITHPDFLSQAQELANYHSQKRNLSTLVVTPQQIYNEFSSASQDVSAIRNFIKMLYDKASSASDAPKYVLMFGDASYDYKNRINNNTNLVPTNQTFESINKITGYCTDDFFGFLDDSENPNIYNSSTTLNILDVGIGRIPASNTTEASNAVAKIKNYDSPNSFGSWKNTMIFNADDEDGNIHLDDAELMAQYVSDSLPQYNNYKIYVDAFEQIATPAGQRAPEANRAIKEHLFNGAFLVNYNGHGGPLGWCEERILSLEDIQGLENNNKLPIFVTATCDFTQFDNPAQKSAGEVLFANPRGGAIALMTTTRLVFQFQNRQMNLNYLKEGFAEMNGTGQMPTLGDAYRLSKNIRYVSSISEFDAANFRKFSLIGDPALPLAFPLYEIQTDSIRDEQAGGLTTDTLKALGKYTVYGKVTDANKQLLNNFNGVVFPTIFDKPKSLTTLAFDGGAKRVFQVQNNVIYKGKATVKDGVFQFTFVVPKDINYSVAKGKISYYANTIDEDATGFDAEVLIGGSSSVAISDEVGPLIRPFLNDEKFVNGGITTPDATLIVKLSDENGVNYSGSSVGHDITAVLDDDAQKTFVLNNFYEADLDSFTAGTVRFPLENLAEGKHSLRIKAWDVLNNSSEAILDFIVVNNSEGKLAHVYNYPNPFSTNTRFMFEHNMPNQNIQVGLKIFSMTGKMVRQFKEIINTPGTRYDGIEWNGMDQYGDKLANGVYLYKLSIKSENGISDDKIQKLIILR